MTSNTPKIAPIPKGLRAITATIATRDVAAAVAFYTEVLGAELVEDLAIPGTDALMHAHIKVAGVPLLLTLDTAAYPTAGTGLLSLYHYLDEIEAAYDAAIAKGAVAVSPLTATWWGDLTGVFVDPFGVRWTLAKRVERLSAEERNERLQALFTAPDPELEQDAAAEVEAEASADDAAA
ncbi:VOC family protein [Actibacterium sp. XHP0104]|uniref:VOC family protein n=1 Tax=Actibacterium sp. XHP0104 TaxID=2984335 RepID=UPI0021E71CC9|nr:VOC family protein [Actibacterium sp. XHP0104]MCV2881573.1 VOC family protein [Actibacterium sp. XHP0104]